MKHQRGWAWPDADEFMVKELSPSGEYQRSHLDAALRYVTDWSIAVDGGAHVGTFSKVLSTRFARVIAVEPSGDTAAALRENMLTFGCANVEIHEAALGATVGYVSMAPLEPRAAAMKNTGARFIQSGGSIPLRRIDDWELPSCGFLKMDIEGSEPDALIGATETLKRCRPVVLFEDKNLWSRHGYRRNEPQCILSALGYQHQMRIGADEIWVRTS